MKLPVPTLLAIALASASASPTEAPMQAAPSASSAESTSREYKGRLEPIGPFRLADLDGRFRTADEFKGKILIISEWASWCGPCVQGFPYVQALYDRVRKDPDIRMVSFNMDAEPSAIGAFLSEFRRKYSFPVLFAAERFRFLELPHTWVVDRDGFIREGFAGEGPSYVEDVLALADAVRRRLPVSELPSDTVRAQRETNARDAARSR